MEFYGQGKVAPHRSPVGLAGVELVCAMQRRDLRFLAYKPLPRRSEVLLYDKMAT